LDNHTANIHNLPLYFDNRSLYVYVRNFATPQKSISAEHRVSKIRRHGYEKTMTTDKVTRDESRAPGSYKHAMNQHVSIAALLRKLLVAM
jgi:hypothetical protein